MTHSVVSDPQQFVDNLIHLDTQAADGGLDLTVSAVFSIDSPGALDFGGSEFSPAERTEIPAELADPDDDYGWWELDAGTYLVRYNETVDPKENLAVINPLPRLVQSGCSHPSLSLSSGDELESPLEMVLRVGERGVRIKENARVSRLVIFE